MSQSPMSITQLCNTEQEQQPLDTHDPEVKLAAEALDSLATGQVGKVSPIVLPPISTLSTAPSTPSLVTPSGSLTSARQSFSSDSTFEDDSKHNNVAAVESYTITPAAVPEQHFIRRVSNHPFVHSALRAYESSKASSPVVKYGAEMVESIASPIYGKFGRQSTLEVTAEHREAHYPNDDDPTTAATTALANTFISDRHYQEPTQRRAKHHSRDELSLGHKKMSSRSTSRSTSPHRPLAAKSPTVIHHHRPSTTAASRSRWKQLVVHAGSAAGTTAAIISEESMKCLKYCLYWLQYATQHIQQQMSLLRNVVVSMATGSPTTTNTTNTTTTTSTTTVSTNTSGALAAIKKEVIETLRKVVEVITKYAGAGLPEQAKASVRSFILALPSRWALLNSSTPQQPEDTSAKLLNFGSESVEMLQSVSSVFSDTVDRADLWLDRLHSVGVTRRSTTRKQPDDTISEVEPMEIN